MAERDAASLAHEDAQARAGALDARRSFLVQAPAGSGKTELLIQRYLALLAVVDEPERIVALTFTRKAAGEMRERVLSALVAARDGTPVGKDHERHTRELALAALARSDALGWGLTDNPARLAMSTFDSLAVGLARRAPLSAALGPHPRFVDDAMPLYRAAAQAALEHAAADDPDWRAFLAHVGNDADRAVQLVAELLRRRDQWLRQVAAEGRDSLREGLERALEDDARAVLAATRAAFPADTGARIAAFAAYASDVLGDHEEDERRAFAAALSACAPAVGLPEARVETLPHWAALAEFLLTARDGRFRRSFNKNNGFPTDARGADGNRQRERKSEMKALCEQLADVPGLDQTLAAAGRLPAPATGDAAWRVVEALIACLRVAVAHLELVFREEGAVDFVQGNLAALSALGADDAPSDLLLRIDARVDHLLLDEFQDTSFTQLRLLERLTEGWHGDASRTIFAVGDPMQSIYRFREAEVRLFVEAQAAGRIAGLPVEPLTLRRNFRAQAELVRWTNATFQRVLGWVSDPARGAVAFAAAVPAIEAVAGAGATLDLALSAADEALRVVRRVRDALDAGSESIAILVRARSHLVELLPALHDAGIDFAAVDLDALGDRQAILDLTSLAHALSQPADRVAWLAVLRAPWCGLALPDLFAVADAVAARRGVLADALDPSLAIDALSDDGRRNLARAAVALRPALAARGRATLASRVRGAWLALGGPACLDDALDLEASERFFALLAEHERGGDLPDRAAFAEALGKLFAAPETPDAARVQVMTMHKSKGLEFDTVIMPGLDRGSRSADAPLLRWRRRERGLVIAPSKPRGGESDPVYDYLGDLDRAESDAESGRLLYVACTRAKTRLHLVGAPPVKVDKDGGADWRPSGGSSLAKLWPAIGGMARPADTVAEGEPGIAGESPPLRRLRQDFVVAIPTDVLGTAPAMSHADEARPPFDWAAETARHVGTLAHRLLARIGTDGCDAWTEARVATAEPRIRAELAAAGYTADEIPVGASKVLDVVRRTLADDRGRWLFDPAHADAHSEWAIAGVESGAIVHIVVDRTFVADGVRWIVDFKTGVHEGGDAAAFLDSEALRYREQLSRYARIVGAMDGRPVRIALYHPLVPGGFREL
jgi:ATP-dependent exoDNAse (exonuclease V) beta subunit